MTRGVALGTVRRAGRFLTRLKGLLGETPEKAEGGLWLVPCHAVHTLGMKWALDIIFLNREREVLKIELNVRPLAWGRFCRGAHSVLEFFHGRWDASLVAVGDQLEFR